ncbi:MAG: UDP-N-acetylenolpyruvoylglucosamine reductase [Verrucomicrobiales bacterium]|nr:UDP-N-acetylenolpyruvoylglucosamine reductase [Verrucomicrobiales bacterium]
MDHYKNGIEEIRSVFSEYLDKCRKKIIYCSHDLEARTLCCGRKNVISYGFEESDNIRGVIKEVRDGSTDFDVYDGAKLLGLVTLGIPGKHNVLNALAVIALATELEVDFSAISNAMAEFRGARRRFDVLYKSSNYSVIDDYGHHPTEIKATIETAKQLNPERLICVFQPHRYSRTKMMLEKFSSAFSGVDKLFVTDVYAAGEELIDGADANAVVRSVIKKDGVDARELTCFDRAHHIIGTEIRPGDNILILGAGNIHEVGSILARDLEVLDKLRRELDDPVTECRIYEPMRRHTTLKVGGPAQYWIEPITIESFSKSLRFFDQLNVPVRVVGRGSNLLICDGGIAGAVIRPSGGEFSEVSVSGDLITAGVGARFKKLSNIAKKNEITGFEWMEGIPGNVGGGLRMNAGAMGVETFDQVVSVKFLDSEGRLHEKSSEELKAKYRNVPELKNNYAVSAVFKGGKGNLKEIEKLTQDSMVKRKASQPIAASAGCIFRNPDHIPAGKLIEEIGMKGFNVGAARVSEVHGNFIINEGGATAEDVLSLIDEVKERALEKCGVKLETEVQIIGEQQITY